MKQLLLVAVLCLVGWALWERYEKDAALELVHAAAFRADSVAAMRDTTRTKCKKSSCFVT